MKLQQSSFAGTVKELQAKKQYNTFLFYGNEPALIGEYAFAIRTALKETHEFVKISPDDTDYLSRATNELFTDSMFGEKKAVYIENYKKTDYRKITEILDKIQSHDENIFILSQDSTLEATNSIRKLCESLPNCACVGVYAESVGVVKLQIQNLLKEKQITASTEVIMFLCETINPSFVTSEIAKIETFFLSETNKTLTQEIAMKLVSQSTDSNIFELPLMIFEKNLPLSLATIDSLYKNDEDPFPIFFGIQSYIKKLYSVQNAIASGEQLEMLLKIHSIHFSQVGTFKKHIGLYNLQSLNKILHSINSMERNIRFGKEFAFNCIKNFAMNLC